MKVNNLNVLEEYLGSLDTSVISKDELEINRDYFLSLLRQLEQNVVSGIVLSDPEAGVESNVHPLAIIDKERLKTLPITHYKSLTNKDQSFSEFTFRVIKMHAGLGSSVKREQHLRECSGRTELGSKGTDLFLQVDGEWRSLAELLLTQIEILQNRGEFQKVVLQNLVNEETFEIVNSLSHKKSPISGKAFGEVINIANNIFQVKMPTVKDSSLTRERFAPAGHGLLGFNLLMSIFENKINTNEIISIGNGEDLNSVADEKIVSWMISDDIPIVMITTTKQEKDKKGGQIALVDSEEGEYLTIVEKAQAEKANQLEYFEKLGLREGDLPSLFNTNIVVINTRALGTLFKRYLSKLDREKLLGILSPDLIKNVKVQDGKEFTQLEGAIGSVLLNIDKYFRLNYSINLIHLLNLDEKERENFFIPIKKMEDFEEIQEKYNFNQDKSIFELKEGK